MSFPHASPFSHVISGLVANLTVLSERTVELDATCQMLEAQCVSLQAQVRAAQSSHPQQAQAVAQRRLRAEAAAFLRERGEHRSSANSSRVMDSGDISVGSNDSAASARRARGVFFNRVRERYPEDSPLVLRSKRMSARVLTAKLEDSIMCRRALFGSPQRLSVLEGLS